MVGEPEAPTAAAESPSLSAASSDSARAPNLVTLLESLLFVADRPIAVRELARAVEVDRRAVEQALDELAESLAGRGVRLQRSDGYVRMVTAPESAAVVQRFLGLDASARLSRAALEVLAIIAYRQPITRPEIEAVRGVDCETALRTLLARELIAPLGRRATVGHPYEYGTTFRFLEYFGLTTLADLPPLEPFVVAEDALATDSGAETGEAASG